MIDTHIIERGVVKVHLEREDDASNCEVEFCVGHAMEMVSELIYIVVNSYSSALGGVGGKRGRGTLLLGEGRRRTVQEEVEEILTQYQYTVYSPW